jgi:uncharacterized membrane protein YecN with MAPEG domain
MVTTGFYAGLLSLLYIYLSCLVVRQRRLYRIAIGDGGHPTLARAIAAHGNFAQYVPFCLIMLTLLELQHLPAIILHILGVTLVIARAAHAYGISQVKEQFKYRRLGIIFTFIFMFVSALMLISKIA